MMCNITEWQNSHKGKKWSELYKEQKCTHFNFVTWHYIAYSCILNMQTLPYSRLEHSQLQQSLHPSKPDLEDWELLLGT